MKIALISMIRNDADILPYFLEQAKELFDFSYIVDINSTDGSLKLLSSSAESCSKIKVFKCQTREKYQSAMMNLLARVAFKNNADWVFFLDSDEFLNMNNKKEFISHLKSFKGASLYMPWLNLTPSKYGDFKFFDISQKIYFSGRPSNLHKVAISKKYFKQFPNFSIHEGNHRVSRSSNLDYYPIEDNNAEIKILHLPIRSYERFEYKIKTAYESLLSKSIRLAGEGSHVIEIYNFLKQSNFKKDNYLNWISAFYDKDKMKNIQVISPEKINWPYIFLPKYLSLVKKTNSNFLKSISEVITLDKKIKWSNTIKKGDVAMAAIINNEITILPQPFNAIGQKKIGKFSSLRNSNHNIPKFLDVNLINDVINISHRKIESITFSAWSPLVPVLFSIFLISKPRRYVELGTHHGMSFFAACQAKEMLDLETECIAIDSWVGEAHAGYYDNSVFENFIKRLVFKYPDSFYIKSDFNNAVNCFDDNSIDLLHIDGFHSYDAVRNDFSTWKSKMSNNGLIIFHDINAHKKGFGVWRFWNEIKDSYPSYSLSHSHGLGILYVGSNKNIINSILTILSKNRNYDSIVQNFYTNIGDLMIENLNLEIQVHDSKNTSNTFSNQSWKEFNLVRNVKSYIFGLTHKLLKAIMPETFFLKLRNFYYKFLKKTNLN
jgi:hypothetical protein